ncbi:amidohydrolase family protein [Novosphingobium sp. KACC 22771]|uniref:amidohydrolase family protein n=1 Tax=Novosphingobium sp. KACC 22771 TaxID=3025670 RepID=UPI002365E4B4|nr:amidohydrolase family protein [Novosphingobium sp. KACC 22771]WDF74507.1 amidohydrolase family protein [Novosphingobium sp. KACC 22771]
MAEDHLAHCGHSRLGQRAAQRGAELVIDLHCHLNVGAADQYIRQEVPDAPDPLTFVSAASRATNAKLFAEIGAKLNGINERLLDMDRLGVDVQAISPSPGQYYYFAPPEVGREAARLVNDRIAQAAAEQPDRLVGMGTVPLQNVDMAIAEMRRCVSDLGLRGIEIGSNVAGRELADEDLRPFFAAAEELGVLVFLHPLGFTHGQRLSEYYLDNIIGNPLESSIALSHLIFSGVLDAHPALKLCVAHGGGFLPGYWGRMDHAWRVRPECRIHTPRPPSDYLRQVWLDTLVFDRKQLDALIESHGADRLCMGTDYPFDMAEPDPVQFHSHLAPDIRAKILGRNAAALLGLDIGHAASIGDASNP